LKAKGLKGQRRSALVRERFSRIAEYRKCLASDYAASLRRELHIEGDPTASVTALITTATSAYLQVVCLTETFTGNRATPKHLASLEVSRGQLQRALRALGLVEHDEKDNVSIVEAALAQIEARIRQPESTDA